MLPISNILGIDRVLFIRYFHINHILLSKEKMLKGLMVILDLSGGVQTSLFALEIQLVLQVQAFWEAISLHFEFERATHDSPQIQDSLCDLKCDNTEPS
jgi:hypothetical protein